MQDVLYNLAVLELCLITAVTLIIHRVVLIKTIRYDH